jgi:putative peptidoglycan lipid II flippase
VILVLAPVPVLATISSIFTGLLNAEGNHRKAVLGPLYGSIASAILLISLPPSIYNLAAILLCYETGRLTGLWLHVRNAGKAFSDKASKSDLGITDWAIKGAKLQILGSFLGALNVFIDILFANTLEAGAVTFIEYSGRLWNLVPLLFTGTLVLVHAKMSRDAASTGFLHVKDVHITSLKIGVLAVVVSIIAIIFCAPVIDLLYGYANLEFQQRKTLSNLLVCYLAGTGPFVAGLVYVRAVSAEGKIRIITIVAAVSVVINLTLNYVLINIYGLNGIGIATSCTHIFSLMLLVYLFQRSSIGKIYSSV